MLSKKEHFEDRTEPEEEAFRLGEMTKSTSSPDTTCTAAEVDRTTGMHPQVTFQFTSFSVGHAHWAALALWDPRGLAVTYILTHHVLTNHRPQITYTDPTWLWVPYLIVGVDFPILCTGIFMRKNSS